MTVCQSSNGSIFIVSTFCILERILVNQLAKDYQKKKLKRALLGGKKVLQRSLPSLWIFWAADNCVTSGEALTLSRSCSVSFGSHHPSVLCQWPPRSKSRRHCPAGKWSTCVSERVRISASHWNLWNGTFRFLKTYSLSPFSSLHTSILSEYQDKIKGLTVSNIQMMFPLLSSVSQSVTHTAGTESAESPRPHWGRKEWGVPTSAGQLRETVEKEGEHCSHPQKADGSVRSHLRPVLPGLPFSGDRECLPHRAGLRHLKPHPQPTEQWARTLFLAFQIQYCRYCRSTSFEENHTQKYIYKRMNSKMIVSKTSWFQ